MGNSNNRYESQLQQYQLNHLLYVENSKQHEADSRLPIIMQHTNCSQSLIRHQTSMTSENQYEQCKENFLSRHNDLTLVASKYIEFPPEESVGCLQVINAKTYYERIISNLSQFKDIPFNDSLHFYSRAFKGFHRLVKLYGPFQVQEEMLHVNEDAEIKVWCSGDISQYRPDFLVNRTADDEKTMVHKTIDMIHENTDPYTSKFPIKEHLDRQHPSNFKDALRVLRMIVDQNHFYVPAKVQCLSSMPRAELLNMLNLSRIKCDRKKRLSPPHNYTEVSEQQNTRSSNVTRTESLGKEKVKEKTRPESQNFDRIIRRERTEPVSSRANSCQVSRFATPVNSSTIITANKNVYGVPYDQKRHMTRPVSSPKININYKDTKRTPNFNRPLQVHPQQIVQAPQSHQPSQTAQNQINHQAPQHSDHSPHHPSSPYPQGHQAHLMGHNSQTQQLLQPNRAFQCPHSRGNNLLPTPNRQFSFATKSPMSYHEYQPLIENHMPSEQNSRLKKVATLNYKYCNPTQDHAHAPFQAHSPIDDYTPSKAPLTDKSNTLSSIPNNTYSNLTDLQSDIPPKTSFFIKKIDFSDHNEHLESKAKIYERMLNDQENDIPKVYVYSSSPPHRHSEKPGKIELKQGINSNHNSNNNNSKRNNSQNCLFTDPKVYELMRNEQPTYSNYFSPIKQNLLLPTLQFKRENEYLPRYSNAEYKYTAGKHYQGSQLDSQEYNPISMEHRETFIDKFKTIQEIQCDDTDNNISYVPLEHSPTTTKSEIVDFGSEVVSREEIVSPRGQEQQQRLFEAFYSGQEDQKYEPNLDQGIMDDLRKLQQRA